MVGYSISGTLGTSIATFMTGITDLEVAWINGAPRLYSANLPGLGAGYAAFDLSGTTGPAGLIGVQSYAAAVGHLRAPDIAILSTGAAPAAHLIATGPSPSGWASYTLGTGGGFGAALNTPLPFNPVAIAGFSAGGTTYAYLAPAGSTQPLAHRLEVNGALTPLWQGGGTTLGGDDLDDLHVALSPAGPVLLSVSASTDTISSQTIAADGTLSAANQVSALVGTGFSRPTEIASLTLLGQSYAIVAANQSSSLSVFRILPGGILQNTDHLVDGLMNRFQGATALAVLQQGEQGFVAVGGADGGIDLMTLLPDGRLVGLTTIVDSAATSLDAVSALALAQVGGRTLLFSASATETGITQIDLALGTPGQVRWLEPGQASGTAGDDILGAGTATTAVYGGGGDDLIAGGGAGVTAELWGGGGADRFILADGAPTIRIRDFQAGIDRLDLSSFPMMRNLGQVTIATTASGAVLTVMGTTIIIDSHDGNPILSTAFPLAHLVPVYRFPPDATPLPPPVTVTGTAGADVLTCAASGGALFGMDGNDSLTGSWADDLLDGGAGQDHMRGGAGVDRIFGWSGHDTAFGGDGGDLLAGGDGNDILYGEAGDDTVSGDTGDDTIDGADGRNALDGGDGNDVIASGAGDDTILGGDGRDRVRPGAGGDLVDAGAGDDDVFSGTGNDSLTGGPGRDTVAGEDGDDLIYGGADDDAIAGLNGDDTLYGGPGNDILWDTDGDDWHFGDDGADTLYGGNGANVLSGDAGGDTIYGGSGADSVYGGLGDDHVLAYGGNDVVYGGDGNDTFNLDTGNDLSFAGAGNDIISGLQGDDTIHGESGDDLIWDHLGSNLITGGDGNDTLYGSDRTSFLDGGAGNDTIYGATGAISLLAGDGADWATAGSGNDSLQGGAGNDWIGGGGGNDLILGDDGNDSIWSQGGNDSLFGGNGDDILWETAGNDSLNGGAGNDSLWGGDGYDQLFGGDDDDLIYGGAQNDVLYGGAGADAISPGRGSDWMAGGAGADQFVFAARDDAVMWSSPDYVLDFTSGEDKLDLSALGLRWSGWTWTPGVRGVSAASYNQHLLIIADASGDGRADFVIGLLDTQTFLPSDIIF